MQKLILNYLKKIIVFSIILALFSAAIYFVIPQKFHTALMPYILFFFVILTFSAHFLLLRFTANNPIKFIRWFMSISIIKLAIHLTIMIVYAINYQIDKKIFILTYSFFYLFYTGFDISSIVVNKVKKKKKTLKNI